MFDGPLEEVGDGLESSVAVIRRADGLARAVG